MILGVTGGFGCGKSTVTRLFESRGFQRIDSDQLVRDRVLTAPDIVGALKERYGARVVGPDGIVARSNLAEIVFNDDAERIWLESLTHPIVFSLWREALASNPAGRWVVEVPLLFEKSLEKWFDFIVCVACSSEQQLARLESRGLSSTFAGQRISKQLPLARKIELSDFVLWNDGSAEFLGAQVDRLANSLAR
jgi:dephospho-CoA kinase